MILREATGNVMKVENALQFSSKNLKTLTIRVYIFILSL